MLRSRKPAHPKLTDGTEFANPTLSGWVCLQRPTRAAIIRAGPKRNSDQWNTTPINIGQRLKELDQQIHTCLRDVRRNLAELEKVSDKESEISNGKSGGQFADMLKSSISRRQTPPQSS